MLHEPAAAAGKDPAAAHKMRLGAWMFVFYAIVYAVFVGINLYDPLLMEKEVVLGLNLATTYGFGLIIFALVQALAYDFFCRRREHAMRDDAEGSN